jgi:hypothetical protein
MVNVAWYGGASWIRQLRMVPTPQYARVFVVKYQILESLKGCLTQIYSALVRWCPEFFGKFAEIQFQDHSRTGILLPNPTFIGLHATVVHALHLSHGGAAEIIDKFYDAFSDEGPTVLSGNRASEEDFRIRLVWSQS